MKLTKEVNYKVTLKAILDDEGNFTLGLSVAVPYGNRTATSTLDSFSEKTIEQVKTVLQKVIEEDVGRAIILAEQEAVQAQTVAVSRGESL